MKARNLSILLISLLISSSCSKAQPKQDNHGSYQFIQEKLNDNLYVLKAPNYNTNAGVFIGNDAILLIDPMTGADNHQNLLNTIKTLSDKPIKYVLNTHSHGDHSGANAFFSELGATIISHQNAKYANAAYDVTFDSTFTLPLGNETIRLQHITSHTIDDALIYFSKSNVLFMGDTYMTNTYPHFYYGGGGTGHIKMLDEAIALGNEQTIIVPGHGDLSSNKEALLTYRQNSLSWIARIKELYNEEKSIDDMAKDAQIIRLSKLFNGTENVSVEGLKRTIEKSISSDLILGIELPTTTLLSYEGKYHYSDDTVEEIIFVDNKLFLRSQGYMYELVALSKTKFHIRGQGLHRNVNFKPNDLELIYFDGTEKRIATKR